VFAVRTFFGIAIPFGNSDYIPFQKLFFWWFKRQQGTTLIVLDLDAVEQKMILTKQMKIAFSSEFRFKILGELKGHFC
jgi:hypothetical protein